MIRFSLLLAFTGCVVTSHVFGEDQLPGTGPLTAEGDIAAQMIAGIDKFLLREIEESVSRRPRFWKRDSSSPAAYSKSIEPNRQRLANILGVGDERVDFDSPELVATTERPALIAQSDRFNVYAVRWPVLSHPRDDIGQPTVHGEGLLFLPTDGEPKGDVIVVPHCDQTPEHVAGLLRGEVKLRDRFAYLVADMGFRVIVPTLISRREAMPKLTHREYLYRSAFELGRHLIGYEVQKVLACVDWFQREAEAQDREAHIGVLGYRDGGMIALYAGALDTRIDATVVAGYCDSRQDIWQQPIDRNVFGLLREFGDAELMSMIRPRRLAVSWAEYDPVTYEGGRGAPAVDQPPDRQSAHDEFNRFQKLTPEFKGTAAWQRSLTLRFHPLHSMHWEIAALTRPDLKFEQRDSISKLKALGPLPDADARHKRQAEQIDLHNQALLEVSALARNEYLKPLYDATSQGLDGYDRVAAEYRQKFYDEVIGRFGYELLPPNARSRKFGEAEGVLHYEVMLDVWEDVFAYGILTLPKDLQLDGGERRPVVVCQHGLEGRPTDVIQGDHRAYHDFATKLAQRGFVTFAPQNIYIFRDGFRTLQRQANPLGKTLFSVMVPQHQQITRWLKSQPFVDGRRIAFYGLSYGGKSAMRIPPLVENYCLSICSADFNEWVWKNATTSPHGQRYTYANKGEYEIFEWNLGGTFNYAEMAALIAPRPFMVERGHFDGVAPDETVAYEFAKVRHHYAARLGIPQRCEIEWFVGPHTINGKGTFDFLHKHLDWPK